MALQYGIKQALRLYENINHQNRFRIGGDVKTFSLLSPRTHMLPFQIKRPAGLFAVSSIKYVSVADGSSLEVLNNLASDELHIFNFETYDYIVHFGQEALAAPVPVGEYYIEISDSIKTWYSELFTVVDFDINDLSTGCIKTKITYFSTCDIADIFYRTQAQGFPQYKNFVYLDVEIGRPEYSYEESGDDDITGVFMEEVKRLEKQHLLQMPLPEFMVDALTLLPLHVGQKGSVEIQTAYGYTEEVDRIAVDPEWQGDEAVWAKTDILLSTEFVVKVGCCKVEDLPLDRCVRNGAEYVARILEGSADYTNFEFTSAKTGGEKIPFEEDDLILVELLTGEVVGRRFVSGAYNSSLVIIAGAVAIDYNELRGDNISPSIYYFWGGSAAVGFLTSPSLVLTDIGAGNFNVSGLCWDDCVVEVWQTQYTGEDKKTTQATGAVYNDTGIDFARDQLGQSVYIVCRGLSCELGQSNAAAMPALQGIGIMVIGNSFIVN